MRGILEDLACRETQLLFKGLLVLWHIVAWLV